MMTTFPRPWMLNIKVGDSLHLTTRSYTKLIIESVDITRHSLFLIRLFPIRGHPFTHRFSYEFLDDYADGILGNQIVTVDNEYYS
jgi:hypothetical protein